MILSAAACAAVFEAGTNVLTLTEGLEEDEFVRSRLTRAEVHRQLQAMAGMLCALSEDTRLRLPELDWTGWAAVGRTLRGPAAEADEAAWFAVRSLVPATLMWLQVYRKSEPEVFAFKP